MMGINTEYMDILLNWDMDIMEKNQGVYSYIWDVRIDVKSCYYILLLHDQDINKWISIYRNIPL